MNDLNDLTVPAAPNRVSIASSCSTVEFTASVWTGRKKDKRASAQVTRDNNAEKGSAGVYKSLLGKCPELEAITAHVGDVRNNTHYKMTMPWSDLGQRLLTTADLPEYRRLMSEKENEFWDLVNTFLRNYQWELSQVQAKLGTLYRPEDYPSEDEIRGKFGFSVVCVPLPETGDFRIDVGREQLQELQESYQQHYTTNITRAMRNVHDRCVNELTKLHNSIDWEDGEKKGKIFSSVFEHCLELIDMLETCNLTNNTQMAAVHAKLKAQFAGKGMQGLSPEALREDATLRRQTRDVLADAIKTLPSLEM
jgi:hypothetical protein